MLRQRKLKKQRLKMIAEKFNEKPLKADWIDFASDLNLMPKSCVDSFNKFNTKGANFSPDEIQLFQADAKSIATFLKVTPGLGKTQIGEFISKGPKDLYPFNNMVIYF